MDSFEFNKISASLIMGALLLMVIGIFTHAVYPEPESDKLAYSIEIEETVAATGGEAPKGPSLAELLASADVSKGERLFKQCVNCHSINKGGAAKLGPNLYGVLGSKMAAADFGAYSSALKKAGLDWSYDNMDQWLKAPKSLVKGTSMAFAGIRKAGQRADLIAYLRTQADEPKPLPEVEQAEEAAPAEEAAEEASE